MKGFEGAQGFGETGINLIRLKIWHQDSLVNEVTAVEHIIIKRLLSNIWFICIIGSPLWFTLFRKSTDNRQGKLLTNIVFSAVAFISPKRLSLGQVLP